MKKLLTVLCLALGIVTMAACGANDKNNTILERDAAIEAIQSYVQAEDYRQEQLDEIDALISEYTGKIGAAATQDEIDALVQEAKGRLDAVKTDAQLDAEEALATAKTAAKAELAAYKNRADYREAEKAQIDAILAEANTAIDGAASEDAVDAAVAAAKNKLNAVKTDAQLAADELAAEKETAKTELAAYKNRVDYRTEQQTKYDNILAEATAAINDATDTAGIEAAVSEAQSKLDALPTDAQLTAAEHLNGLKAQQKSELATYKSRDAYRQKEQTEYDRILEEANEAIDNALTEQAITEAVNAAHAQLDGLKTDAEYKAEELAALNAAKQTAKDALDNHFKEADFLEEDWSQIESAIAEYKTQIDAKTTIDEVEALAESAKSALDETWLAQRAFPVAAAQTENGRIEVSAERAKAGTKITFSCEADAGFRAYNGSLTVKAESGDELPVTRASFTMPAEGVEISVSFVKETERGVPVRLVSPAEENIEGHKLGWESVTESGWDQWPGQTNKQSVRIEGFGYANHLTIHGKTGGEVGFTYDLGKLGEKYEYFSAEVGIHFDKTNNTYSTMHAIVRFQKQGSDTWDEAEKVLLYAMQSPKLLRVKIPEDAVKMQLYADPGDPEKDDFDDRNNFDIIVWGNPMLYNGTLGENRDSISLGTVEPTSATTLGYVDPLNYGINSSSGHNNLPQVNGKLYRDAYMTHGTGVAGDDKGFTFDVTDFCGEGGLDTLVGYVGMGDDQYSGQAKLVIKVDGVVKFEKIMETKEDAVPVRIPVLGAKTLELLIADAGDGNIVAEVCAFCEMTLIREAAHPIDEKTVLLSDLDYTGTTFWDGIAAKYYKWSDLFLRNNELERQYLTPYTKIDGALRDGGFLTHASSSAEEWHGFTFDLNGEEFDTLIGAFGIYDASDISGGFPNKQMAYKIMADMTGDGTCETELVASTTVSSHEIASINVSVKGAKKIALLMSCGSDGATGDGDLGIFTGMYLTSAAKA